MIADTLTLTVGFTPTPTPALPLEPLQALDLLAADLTRPYVVQRFVDRLNLFTGLVLLSYAIYLRFIAVKQVPRLVEYAYVVCGLFYFISGMLELSNPSYYVSAVRVGRQLSVLFLATVLFQYLVVMTDLQHPSDRARELLADLRARRRDRDLGDDLGDGPRDGPDD